MSKPEVKVFDRGNPCTKVDIWNCFRGARGFIKVQVDEAKAVIGANVPRVMEREGRLVCSAVRNVDYYVLTEEGKVWLDKGIRSYLKNHPASIARMQYKPRDKVATKRKRVRK